MLAAVSYFALRTVEVLFRSPLPREFLERNMDILRTISEAAKYHACGYDDELAMSSYLKLVGEILTSSSSEELACQMEKLLLQEWGDTVTF